MKKYLKPSLNKRALRSSLEEHMEAYVNAREKISSCFRVDLDNYTRFVFDEEKIEPGCIIKILESNLSSINKNDTFLVATVAEDHLNLARESDNHLLTVRLDIEPVVLKEVQFTYVRRDL